MQSECWTGDETGVLEISRPPDSEPASLSARICRCTVGSRRNSAILTTRLADVRRLFSTDCS